MRKHLPTRTLREHPDLNQLKRQAKELLAAFTSGDANAVAEVDAHYRGANAAKFALHDAQLVLARSYGFDSWPKLKAFVNGVNVRRLAEAVKRGDIARVRKMLDVRPELVNLDMAENDEHRALHYAVFERNAEMVRLLIARGADARKGIYPHREATTPLRIAMDRGYDEIVAILKEAAKPEADALAEAFGRGDEAHALAMLQGDPALLQTPNRNGWTPLHLAAAVRSERVTAWLLAHGAEVNRRGPRDRTPLDQAVGRPWRTANGATGFAAIAGMLLEHGAELTARSAVALGEADWLRARHAAGALENPIEDWGGLLTIAVIHDQPEMLALLLDLGFDPEERVRIEGLEEVLYSQGMPLWHCARLGKAQMAEVLLQRGASPNSHVYASGTAVYSAYRQGDRALVELLKRYGGVVDPITVGLFRETEMARQMMAEGPAPGVAEDLLRGATDGGDPEAVRMALEHVDWARDDERWFWILLQPLRGSNWDSVQPGTYAECFRMVLARCDANLRHPRFGRTILHDVAALGRHEAVEFARMLLDAGARMDERDDVLKSTPLGWACRWGRLEIVKLLLERGADPVEAGAEPWATPRAWADKMGHHAVLAMLS
jgi:ankyrin repeat protein